MNWKKNNHTFCYEYYVAKQLLERLKQSFNVKVEDPHHIYIKEQTKHIPRSSFNYNKV